MCRADRRHTPLGSQPDDLLTADCRWIQVYRKEKNASSCRLRMTTLRRKCGLEVSMDATREPHLATVRFPSTSAEDRARERTLAAGANEYVVKSGDIDAFVEAAQGRVRRHY